MTLRRTFIIQVALAAGVCAVLLATSPVAPAAQLATAINYTYHRVMPGVASDGVY